ncbi:MAG TPA: AAA family ATPase [Acidimicrobiales bacterium]|nr:AAA family ATPase [Acidimicrobiales bacterium]
MDLQSLRQSKVVRVSKADVGATRERVRRALLWRLFLVLAPFMLWLWYRLAMEDPVGLPRLTPKVLGFLPILVLIVMLGIALMVPFVAAGRSPHVLFRPADIDLSLEDVKGLPVVVDEVIKTLNLFLGHKTFKERMGGTPRRAILFEGPPGTGKTYLAKAMAREAGVPFLFVSSSAFQSMYYGQTNRKIRSYFKALRSAARREGGAIGFIEEIDAIGAARGGMGGNSTQREGISGVVNELLIQLQSFDQPPAATRLASWFVERINRLLPVQQQLRRAKPRTANILVVGATNRASDLDPALLRPGRFDRSIHFDLPSRAGRREILDYYLDRKAHDVELDDPISRDTLAAMTFGYSPAMLEHLLDEALVWALRRGADGLSWHDIQQAKMTEEIGLAQPVAYTEAERRAIATHEAGHATVAYLVGRSRKLEVLSIIKRKDALGLLAHSEREERYTKTKTELEELIRIAMGGLVAEELFFGETGSGVAGDLQAATTAAAQMVGSFGMTGSLFSHDAVASPGANLVAKVSATDEGRAAIDAILDRARDEVRELITANRHVVGALRDALLVHDELVGPQILDVIGTAVAPPLGAPSTVMRTSDWQDPETSPPD